jgi:hypothetical protein
MLTDLVTSAKELRSPLVLGYSLLFTAWLLLRDNISKATSSSSLAAGIQDGIESLGGAGELALITFAAAMLGSLVWNVGIARVVAALKRTFHHPDWHLWIQQAQDTVREYEEYRVTTHKGVTARGPSSSDAKHKVPSPLWARHLQTEVDDRVRKASEVDFRITLAISLLPVATALSIEGGGYWWLSWIAPAVIWLDVSIIKHTTAALLLDYEIRDDEQMLHQLQNNLGQYESLPNEQSSEQERAQDHLRNNIAKLERKLKALRAKRSHRSARAFGWIRGATKP